MSQDSNMTGSLLVAHPTLMDPNFRRTVLFLSHHSPSEGAMGLVLNRPTGETLADIVGAPAVPIHYGGPVETGQILLASIQWRENPTLVAFRTFAGPLADDPIDPCWHEGLRAFAGYSGWTEGQLEREISDNAWLVIPPSRELIEMHEPHEAWKTLMRQTSPVLHLLSEAPDHPEHN